MSKAIAIVAAIADLALAALLIGVSGFILGGGPQGMNAGGLIAIGYVGAIIACVGAPIAGLVLVKKGKPDAGMIVALLPLLGAAIAMLVPAPY